MSEQGETIRKNITYDTVEDKEIHEWLESLPPRTHSLYIRKALKEYITNDRPIEYISEVNKRLDLIEEKLKIKYEDHSSVKKNKKDETNESESKENKNDNFVNADDMLKNLGK